MRGVCVVYVGMSSCVNAGVNAGVRACVEEKWMMRAGVMRGCVGR